MGTLYLNPPHNAGTAATDGRSDFVSTSRDESLMARLLNAKGTDDLVSRDETLKRHAATRPRPPHCPQSFGETRSPDGEVEEVRAAVVKSLKLLAGEGGIFEITPPRAKTFEPEGIEDMAEMSAYRAFTAERAISPKTLPNLGA